MLDIEQMGQWWAYLSFCLADNIVSKDCNSHWSIIVLGGFVLALLLLVFAGYSFFKVSREVRRNRLSLRDRDIAAIEKMVDEQFETGGERIVRVLAEKYRKAFERSKLAGWRIHTGS